MILKPETYHFHRLDLTRQSGFIVTIYDEDGMRLAATAPLATPRILGCPPSSPSSFWDRWLYPTITAATKSVAANRNAATQPNTVIRPSSLTCLSNSSELIAASGRLTRSLLFMWSSLEKGRSVNFWLSCPAQVEATRYALNV